MGFDMKKMMRQVQQLQAEVERLKAELAERTVEGSAGGGAVTVVATGAQEVRSVRIGDGIVPEEDREALEDLVKAAVNDALSRSRQMAEAEMGKATGGFGLPPGLS